MAMVQAMIKKICSPEILTNYNEILEQLKDMFRTNMPTEVIASLINNQILDEGEWTVDFYAVTGFNGSETTYSAPGSYAYVMIPNDEDIAQAKELIDNVLNEKP